MVATNWDKRYRNNDSPWVHEAPIQNLVPIIKKFLPHNSCILEIGCGYGVEAIALSKIGYQVTAVDVSAHAIEQALAKQSEVTFRVCDVLNDPITQVFNAVLDIAVLMPLATKNHLQHQFIDKVVSLLKAGDYWFSMSCIIEEVTIQEKATGVQGPPAFVLEDFLQWIKPRFSLIATVDTTYGVNRKEKTVLFPAKIFVLKKHNSE